MPAPSVTPPTPPSPVLHRTQFLRGVRDSMAKALALGLGDTPTEERAPPSPPPPPPPPPLPASPQQPKQRPSPQQQQQPPPPKQQKPVQSPNTRITLGHLKRLIGAGAGGGGGEPAAAPPQLTRTPPRAAAAPAAKTALRSPARVLQLPDQLLRASSRVLSAVDPQLSRPPPPAPPPATSLKPIVRLPEGSAAESVGEEPAANGDASEERKRMIALAQLKILQRKAPSPQKLAAQESMTGGGQDGSPLKTYGRRAEMVATPASNGAASETPRKNVKLMPPLTLLVPPVKPQPPPPTDMQLKPDVEDASRCASGLLIRKTYYKVAAAPANSERNGALPPPPPPPQPMMVRRPRGRPRAAAAAAAAAVTQSGTNSAAPAPSAAPAVPPSPAAVAVPSPAAAKAVVSSGSTEEAGRARRAAAPDVAPPAAAGAVKRRHGSSGRSSDASSGRSSAAADNSPKSKKSRFHTRDLKSLLADEGVINILSNMEALLGEKRRTRVASSERPLSRASSSGLRETVSLAPGSRRARPATVTASTLKKTGRTVNKIKAKALKVKKQAEAKKAAKAATSAKLKALKAKVKQEPKSPCPSPKPAPKPAVKGADKVSSSSAPKAATQKVIVKVVTVTKAAKSNKSLSPAAVATKKPKSAPAVLVQLKPKPAAAPVIQLKPKPAAATVIQLKPKSTAAAVIKLKPKSTTATLIQLKPKSTTATLIQLKPKSTSAAVQPKPKKQPSSADRPGASSSSTGKKSPPSVSAAAAPAAKFTAPASQEKTQLAQDRNLNIIERKTAKPAERKKSVLAEESQQAAQPASPASTKSSSKNSSKSSSPLPMAQTSNPMPASPSSLSYSSLQRRLEVATLKQVRRKEAAGDRERSSSRSNLGTVRHREISVKKFDRFHQVILCPVTTRLKAGLNVQVMRELREYLVACERDPACRAVLLTSSAGPFCQGLDYTCLLGLSPEKRRRAAEELAKELKEFVRTMAGFSKPLLAGVTGACVGLGVSLLPLCDLVYVTEKATLLMPYSRLGTVPEGGATHSLTALLGHAKAGAMVMTGRAMTGTEAVSANLATGLVWSATAYEELVALARQMLDNAAQLQALESTKALLRHSLRAKLEQALHSECRLLVHQWCAPEFQQRVKQLYDEGPLLLQKPGFDTQ